MYGAIELRGARENNLKGISLDIPKRQLTVFSGVSGSGKSSLVFGTMAAESQRLLNETAGSPAELVRAPSSVTGAYLARHVA
jgi:excinuclease UvrABC ATPase subunit